ncbi:exocyst complex component 3-like isoform X2 [Pristis pectinata]|uniref:exocyst complex component 3-like isoform X2 n=1 Tax=Pristis pectinata TaxID=685728 RepID=UPI00223E69B3|nr:exocyst complex component 3-like isoform X2 [Pristis pectinata]
MSNTEIVLSDNLPSTKDSPDRGQAASNTSNIEDGTNKVRQSSFKTSKKASEETSNAEVKVSDENPKEQSGLLRNIYRLSKRKLSFSPPKSSDKDKTKAVLNENTANNSEMGIREEEARVEDDKMVENTKSPLSVMEIHQLIIRNLLVEANENINKMEKELLNERKPAKDEEYHQQYMVKVRDLNLLCDALAEQMMSIIANSLTVVKENSNYLCLAVKVIELEEAADKEWQEQMNHSDVESFRRPRKWQELWRETVTKSVKDRIANVPLFTKEQKAHWMAQHLSDLQQIIVEDLKTVKSFIQKCYPESYNIFNVYLKCYHQTVASHLECIQQKQLESSDLYSLLNWIIHTYKSDNIMNHPDLSPKVNIEGLGPLLDEQIIKNIMAKYVEALKFTVPLWMRNILKEDKAKWSEPEAHEPEIMMGCYHSHVASDISEMIVAHLNESGKISKDLKEKVLCYYLEELSNFIHCYQQDLKDRKQSVPNPLPLLIVSINSYIDLGKFIKTLKEDNAAHVNKVEKILKKAVQELNKILSDDLLFKVLVLISDLHYRFVREYITPIMKRHVSYKSSTKRVTAANKIREELGAINKMYEEFGSSASWLFPVTQHLSDFIGTNENELESKLNALFEDYPDIGEEHISALLYFRGISRGEKKNKLMKYFNQLEKNLKDPMKTTHPFLFAEIITGPVTCLPSF